MVACKERCRDSLLHDIIPDLYHIFDCYYVVRASNGRRELPVATWVDITDTECGRCAVNNSQHTHLYVIMRLPYDVYLEDSWAIHASGESKQ